MRLIITDVSVLFDLFYLEVLPEFFDLSFEICVTAFVYNEIVVEEQVVIFEQFKQQGKLRVLKLLQNELEAVLAFKTFRSLKSLPDKTILWQAKQLNCPILTCDEKLRKEALDHGLEVHGSIWVITELNKQFLISNQRAIDVLNRLKLINVRLPMNEIDRIIYGLNA